jgi:hypothetical protein
LAFWIGGQYYAPANADASGLSTSISISLGSYGSAAGACLPQAFNAGVLMTPLTNAQVGLPATIASPLKLK